MERLNYWARLDLFPAHLFNLVASLFSIVLSVLWMYFSPHRGPENLGSSETLDRLEKVFKWEARALPIGIVLGIALYGFGPDVSWWRFVQVTVMLGITLGLLVTDSLFTVLVTAVFLRPILQTLHSASQRRTGGNR